MPLAGRKIKQDAAIRIMSRGRYDDANVARAVTAFRLTDGKQVWRTPIEIPTPAVPPEKWPIGKDGKPHEPERAALKPLICVGDMILLYTSMYQARADDSALHAMDVATGKFRWSTNLPEGSRPGRISNTDSANAILVRGGEIFTSADTARAASSASTLRPARSRVPPRAASRNSPTPVNAACRAAP